MTAAAKLQPEVRERPILFSGPMVRAILEGRKTQTRRLVKPQPEVVRGEFKGADARPSDGLRIVRGTERVTVNLAFPECLRTAHDFCPYGRPGDRLWVREAWRHAASCPFARESAGCADRRHNFYRADGAAAGVRWAPSLCMPRWASRLTLEVTDVRVQRLQDISEEDARAEGVEPDRDYWPDPARAHRVAFHWLWDSIHGEGAWESNPWVWALTFRRVP